LNPWKVVRYCKLESKKWRYVLIRCIGRCQNPWFFSGHPWGPRDLPGPQGSSVLVGWAGAANPMGRVGFGLQWSHVVERCILCLRNTSCIIMLHQFTRLMTCILVYTYLMCIYILYIYSIYSIYIYAYLKLHTWNSPDFWHLLTEQLVDCSVSQVWRLFYWNCMAMNVSQPHLQLFCQRVHKPTRNAVMVPYTLHMSKWNYQVPVIYIYMGWNNPIVTAKGPKNCLKPDLAAHVLGIGTTHPCDLRRCFLRRVQHAGGHLG
jgi:hypothetical protein